MIDKRKLILLRWKVCSDVLVDNCLSVAACQIKIFAKTSRENAVGNYQTRFSFNVHLFFMTISSTDFTANFPSFVRKTSPIVTFFADLMKISLSLLSVYSIMCSLVTLSVYFEFVKQMSFPLNSPSITCLTVTRVLVFYFLLLTKTDLSRSFSIILYRYPLHHQL